MFVQLGQFSYDQRGKVTGKINEDAQDDIGMAVLLVVYWRLCILSADPEVTDVWHDYSRLPAVCTEPTCRTQAQTAGNYRLCSARYRALA